MNSEIMAARYSILWQNEFQIQTILLLYNNDIKHYNFSGYLHK